MSRRGTKTTSRAFNAMKLLDQGMSKNDILTTMPEYGRSKAGEDRLRRDIAFLKRKGHEFSKTGKRFVRIPPRQVCIDWDDPRLTEDERANLSLILAKIDQQPPCKTSPNAPSPAPLSEPLITPDLQHFQSGM